MIACYTSANDAVTATEIALHASRLAQEAGYTALAIGALGPVVGYMTTAGQLGEAHQLAQEAIRLGAPSRGFVLPDVGWPIIWQAEILREWNQLDAARDLVEEAIPLCQQAGSFVKSMYLVCGYATLAHICLSSGELDRAQFALQEVERLGRQMSQPIYQYFRSLYTTADQVRFWLDSKDLDRAALWVQERDLLGLHSTPFVHEREEVARARFLLATSEPTVALQRLEPVLERATTGQRWKHVFEVHLLQALAHQMCGQEEQALSALSEAVRLAEPEVYIRSFVDEGPPMAALLSQLREQQQKHGPTPYLDTVLAAFPPQDKARKRKRKQDKVAMH